MSKNIFSYKGGLATWGRQISKAHVGNKKEFLKSHKNTHTIDSKRNPNPAQQVDLTKKSNFETAQSISLSYMENECYGYPWLNCAFPWLMETYN